MGKPFTAERLAAIRRMRTARRLYKKQPLFAYTLMREDFSGYTYDQFLEDLRLRKPAKKKKAKIPLKRYGRYSRMQQLITQYRSTGDIRYATQAEQLSRHLTTPYRVMVRVREGILEYFFSPLIAIASIEQLVKRLAACSSESEADKMVMDFRKMEHSR